MPVTDFLTWRFALAAVAMLLLRPRSVAQLGPVGLPGGLVVPPDASVWAALLLTALAATALAFVVQTWAQAHLPPTRAAVIMTMEPVFAGIFAVAVAGERLGTRTVVGALLVLV